MTDSTNLIRIVQETQPDEIYNLAAQSPRAGQLRDGRNTPPTPTAWGPFACWRRSAFWA